MNGGIRSSTGKGGPPAGGFTRPEGFDRTLSGSNCRDTRYRFSKPGFGVTVDRRLLRPHLHRGGR